LPVDCVAAVVIFAAVFVVARFASDLLVVRMLRPHWPFPAPGG